MTKCQDCELAKTGQCFGSYTCEGCGDEICPEEMFGDDLGGHYCERCHDRQDDNLYCDRCGCVVERGDEHGRDGYEEVYCADCWQEYFGGDPRQ